MFAFWKYGNNKVYPPPQRFRALKWLEEKAASRRLSAHVWKRTLCVHFFWNLLLRETINALAAAEPPPYAPRGAGARSAGCRPSQRPAGGGTALRGRRLGETGGGGKWDWCVCVWMCVWMCVDVCVRCRCPPRLPVAGQEERSFGTWGHSTGCVLENRERLNTGQALQRPCFDEPGLGGKEWLIQVILGSGAGESTGKGISD